MTKIGYIQYSPVFGEKEKNFEAILTLASGIRADLIVLPELFATGYTFVSKEEAGSFAETAGGETFRFLCALSGSKIADRTAIPNEQLRSRSVPTPHP